MLSVLEWLGQKVYWGAGVCVVVITSGEQNRRSQASAFAAPSPPPPSSPFGVLVPSFWEAVM